MALIDCPECGSKVSDAAPACPNCGFPLKKTPDVPARPKKKNMTAIILVSALAIIVIVVALLFVLFNTTEKNAVIENEEIVYQEPEPAQIPENTVTLPDVTFDVYQEYPLEQRYNLRTNTWEDYRINSVSWFFNNNPSIQSLELTIDYSCLGYNSPKDPFDIHIQVNIYNSDNQLVTSQLHNSLAYMENGVATVPVFFMINGGNYLYDGTYYIEILPTS